MAHTADLLTPAKSDLLWPSAFVVPKSLRSICALDAKTEENLKMELPMSMRGLVQNKTEEEQTTTE
jgi:hypothetical protein